MQGTIKKRINSAILTCFLFALLALSVAHLPAIRDGIISALSICARTIIPTLFPFLILSDLLLSTEETERVLTLLGRPFAKILRLSDVGGAVFLLGTFFGFPMGARSAARFYSESRLSKEEAERLLLFSGNASPFFLVGSVGIGMLSSAKAGVTLYVLQVLVSLGCGIILGLLSPKKAYTSMSPSLTQKKISISRTVQGAVRQSLFITGYIVFFSAILAFILPYVKNAFLAGLFASLLEIGNACAHATTYGRLTLPFCAFGACFSGLSVYFQTLDCIESTDLSTKRYLPIKLLCGAIGFHLAFLFD